MLPGRRMRGSRRPPLQGSFGFDEIVSRPREAGMCFGVAPSAPVRWGCFPAEKSGAYAAGPAGSSSVASFARAFFFPTSAVTQMLIS